MFSVFSNIEQSCIIPGFSEMKPSEIIKALANSYDGEFNRFFICNADDETLYILKPKAIDVLKWINRRIVFELPNVDYRTVGVRIRIATNMLNKLVEEDIIPKHVAIVYHTRLVDRVGEVLGKINTEDLPF